MNATVARIVEIMFQDTVLSEEVQALKDEVMNNCQERYQDMLARGLDEDSAVAAVVDSLKGMEEVIAQYPKKNYASAVEPEQKLVFDPAVVGKVKCFMIADDVNIIPSDDGMIHIEYDKEAMPGTTVDLNGDVLRIARQGVIKEKTENSFSWSGNWDTFSDLFNDLKKAFKGISVHIGTSSGELTVSLPVNRSFELEIHTTSGDVDMNGVNAKDIMVETTSGDVDIALSENVMPGQIRVKGSSGDADINAHTAKLIINSVSGDVDYHGNCPDMNITTVSGDVQTNGAAQCVFIKTVSGDADMDLTDDNLQEITCNTVSGDLEVQLPEGLRGQVHVHMQSTSGDVYNRFGEAYGSARAVINMKSVSGDVTLC